MGNWDFSGDEVLFLLIAGLAAALGAIIWYATLTRATHGGAGGGLRVYTTLDLDVQLAAERAMEEQLRAVEAMPGFRHTTYAEYLEQQGQGAEAADDNAPNSPYLQGFRELARETTRGCIVLERPDLLQQLVQAHHAQDGTARQTALAELDAMQIRPSQYNPAEAIPEKSLAYRLAKKWFFNSFGVYDGRNHSRASAPAMLRERQASAATGDELVKLDV